MSSTPHLSISLSPHLTALALIADALAGRRRGLPEVWRRALSSGVGGLGHEAVRPLAAPGRSIAPDSLVPLSPVNGDVSVQEQLSALRDLPPDGLIADLERTFGRGLPPVRWRPAAERPARWLHGYAGAVADVWKSAEPLWRRARPLLDREVERVGVATVRGGPELLLASLTSRIVYGERGLLIHGTERDRHELGNRKIVLVPLLIGPVRADLLCALDQPMTMSMLATDMMIAPSGLTYHCDRLRAGRLITRERRGREVWIARTGRAEELLELFRR
ncbi:ArsR/SmtB family transcription factor [Nonomuraea turcica]|uniref:ArsR/SmtB family transcription factor n=1 Tax=Nonomuraea sp. G32 TaxID=3067274 RepID=UPI00273B84D7|nr:winged helix-turn-helix domain-containing protein [Nonomuraea sp. G32]MDP4511695.1 winged helix-turn-helix domain-containing protein [Nonomuraea sp. G32]